MVDAAPLRALVSQYTRTMVGRYEIGEVLYRLTDDALAVVGVDGAGISVADTEGRLRFVAATDETVVRIEEHQIASGNGPCHVAFASGERVVVPDLRELDDERWGDHPAFAMEHGCLSLSAFPMSVEERQIGALDVYRRRPGAWDEETLANAQLVADMATGLIVNHRALEDTQTLASQLQDALDSRVVIEQAKGILVERHGGDMADAFSRLRSHARSNRRKLRDVAAYVIEHRDLPEPGHGATARRQADGV